ncbi:hypothetical protein [Glaciecola sp. SC05]|uniref:hypothetical protein n=1 Tax=Glaciecola sp. SC05 TaxID=1987355 RepID=UPI0035283A71
MKTLYILLIAIVTLTLSACFGESETVETTSAKSPVSESATSSFAKELIDEQGCDPRIANAMAPFDSDYGECDMPKFVEVCGADNFDAGVALIAEVRELQSGLNPWVWSCARRMEPKVALVAACQYRMGQSQQVCECSVNASYESDDDKQMLEWLAFTEANDPHSKLGKFKEWSSFSENGRWEELTEVRARHYDRIEKCM